MRAVICRDWGPPESLVCGELPSPVPGPGEVRIRVHAAGVNFADSLLIARKYQERPPLPFSPGFEVGGEVIDCGEGVDHVGPGDRVCGFMRWGGYAEEAVAPSRSVYPIPDDMDFEAAAAFAVTYGTSHIGLDFRGGLKPGETLLVHGAAGGVGLTAVEIGKAMGATVIATAGGPDKLAVARDHGADHLVDYRAEDIREAVNGITGGRGADVVYDPVGGDVFDASLRCVAPEGRLLIIGFAAGRIQEIPANRLLVKSVAAIGVYWNSYVERYPEMVRDSFRTLFGWYSEGRLRPHISARFPLEKAPDALALLLQRRSTGKVILTMDGGG